MASSRRRCTPDQIICKLSEGHEQLAAGWELDEVCRHLEIAESTWYRWLEQYDGMEANDAKRLEELEVENTWLEKLVAEAELDRSMLEELVEETSDRTASAVPSGFGATGSGSANAEPAEWSACSAPLDVVSHRRPATTGNGSGCSWASSRSAVRVGAGEVLHSRVG